MVYQQTKWEIIMNLNYRILIEQKCCFVNDRKWQWLLERHKRK